MPANAIRFPPLAGVRLGRMDDERLAELAAAGDERAFEVLYDRHHRALLGFCRHMLGSPEEAEDALQQTFLRAHRALVARGAPGGVRPWLFTIARNRCLSMLSARKPAGVPADEVEPAVEGLGAEVERRADLRALVGDIGRLPEDQRAALVLSELADLSHAEIGTVIGVPAGKVKALVHQARTRLMAEREAREMPCEDVRRRLATARGGELRRGPLRRHLAVCEPCRDYRDAVREQRVALGLVLPVIPSAGLKEAILGTLGGGGGGAVAALAGGGGLGAKLAVGVVIAGGAGGGAAVVSDVGREAPAPRPAAVTRPASPTPAPEPARTAPKRTVADALAPARRTATPRRIRARGVPDTRGQRRRARTPAGAKPVPPGQAKQPEARAEREAAKEQRVAARDQRKAARVLPPAAKPAKPVKPLKLKPARPAKPVVPAPTVTPPPAPGPPAHASPRSFR